MAEPAPQSPSATVTHWQCGVCRQTFTSDQEVVAHLRSAHSYDADVPLVHVGATTWNMDRHNLFDREAASQHRCESLVVPVVPHSKPIRFMRDVEGAVRIQGGHFAGSAPLGSVPMHTQLAWSAVPPTPNGSRAGCPVIAQTPKSAQRTPDRAKSDAMWLNVGAEGYRLQAGDLFKIGRYKITIRQVCLEGPPQVPSYSSSHDEGTAPLRVITTGDTTDPPVCRICLGGLDTPAATPENSKRSQNPFRMDADGEDPANEEFEEAPRSPSKEPAKEDDDDPLISAPCLCKGATRLVHLGCLKNWLDVRYSVSIKDGCYYSFKPPGCEICRTEFPVTLHRTDLNPAGAEPVSLLKSLPAVEPPFLVLSIPRGSGEDVRTRPHGERFIFAPGDSGRTLSMGRSSQAELRVQDVSVSRVHAIIAFHNGAFVLRDNNAKFQTLVLPRGPEQLADQTKEPLSVQAGRTVLSFALLNPSA